VVVVVAPAQVVAQYHMQVYQAVLVEEAVA
jgi:hypothetical protein